MRWGDGSNIQVDVGGGAVGGWGDGRSGNHRRIDIGGGGRKQKRVNRFLNEILIRMLAITSLS